MNKYMQLIQMIEKLNSHLIDPMIITTLKRNNKVVSQAFRNYDVQLPALAAGWWIDRRNGDALFLGKTLPEAIDWVNGHLEDYA